MTKHIDKLYQTDKVALITGGYSGIGLGVANIFAEAGAKLAIAGVDDETGQKVVVDFNAAGTEARYYPCDVTDVAAVDELAKAVANDFGEVHILVNCAGICRNTAAEEVTPEQWEQVLGINLTGTFNMCQAMGKHWIQAGQEGSIVNISSISDRVAMFPQKQVDYHASKAGVSMVTKCLAFEWADKNIRVNAVAPGYIKTPLLERGMNDEGWGDEWLYRTPVDRMGTPEEVGSLVLFIASDIAAFMTGSVVVIDGGYTVL